METITLKKRGGNATKGPHKGIYMWYVYILRCADNTLYTGSTTDIDRRVREHNCKKGGGCTRARLPVKLIYQETYLSRSRAQAREAQIKKLTHKEKLDSIRSDLTFS